MARSRSLEVLQDIFPNQAVISATEAGKAISLAPQTVKNQVSMGNFPIPTFLIGGKRICRLTDVADYIENIGKRPGRPYGSTKAARIAAESATRTDPHSPTRSPTP